MDARTTPFNGRVAHTSLRGKVEAERFEEGEERTIIQPAAPLLDAPSGSRLRELLLGEGFRALDLRDSHMFGMASKDGYAGWVPADALTKTAPPDHWIVATRTCALARPDLKAVGGEMGLSFGCRVTVLERQNGWAEIDGHGCLRPKRLFVPEPHIAPLSERFGDPAAVAELFLHTPYLWGGNTSFGIDCSGLVQIALLACGIVCPGDSYQQEASVGTPLPPGSPLQRNDLVFWKGHVAIALDEARIVHANARHMAVAIEPFETARARIAASDGGGVTAVRRP